MKYIVFVSIFIQIFASELYAAENVNGYVTRGGQNTQSYVRSKRDQINNNNWSVKGNTNPYSAKNGTSGRTWNDKAPNRNFRKYGNRGYVK